MLTKDTATSKNAVSAIEETLKMFSTIFLKITVFQIAQRDGSQRKRKRNGITFQRWRELKS